MADDNLDEDLFADLYDGDDTPAQPAPSHIDSAIAEPSQPTPPEPSIADQVVPTQHDMNVPAIAASSDLSFMNGQGDASANIDQSYGGNEHGGSYEEPEENYGPIGIKEDGKMFIGGLNWETTDQSLKDYFSEFGEVLECTVMRDGATGRSRGFGFLTFKDPKTVNTVMVKEHYLDGKIIDPKRAIPREEQERTSKIFVGGVSQEATERDFKEFFMQFGRVIDATLMMDKDTGRPRGFGFVTFDGDEAVDRTLNGPLEIHGKPIEVKRAQPRGNMHDEDRGGGRFGRRGDKFSRGQQDNNQQSNQGFENQQVQNQNGTQNGLSPAMMAQYWQRMQQYFAMMQQQMSTMNQGQQQMNPMAAMGGQMNPAMMQQMMAMQQHGNQGISPGGTPNPQSPGANGQGMNPAMMQQMQQMQQMQMQMQQQQAGNQQGYSSGATPDNGDPFSPPGGPGSAAAAAAANRAGFTAHEQLAFEQQKYERQQAQRMQQNQQYTQNYGGGSMSSWEGMYDDVPAPNMAPQGPSGGGGGRGGFQGGHGGHGGGKWQNRNRGGGHGGGSSQTPPVQPSNAPANAPTGPKNAGRPGANYRGGGRGGNRGWRPY